MCTLDMLESNSYRFSKYTCKMRVYGLLNVYCDRNKTGATRFCFHSQGTVDLCFLILENVELKYTFIP